MDCVGGGIHYSDWDLWADCKFCIHVDDESGHQSVIFLAYGVIRIALRSDTCDGYSGFPVFHLASHAGEINAVQNEISNITEINRGLA